MLDHVEVDVTDYERSKTFHLTENSELSALFAGSAGLSIYLVHAFRDPHGPAAERQRGQR